MPEYSIDIQNYVPVVQEEIRKKTLEIKEENLRTKKKEAALRELEHDLEAYTSQSGLANVPLNPQRRQRQFRSFFTVSAASLSCRKGLRSNQECDCFKEFEELWSYCSSEDLWPLYVLLGPEYFEPGAITLDPYHPPQSILSYREFLWRAVDHLYGRWCDSRHFREPHNLPQLFQTLYSENAHRSLCAIYLYILGDKIGKFSIAKSDEPDKCPWGEPPGTESKSSHQIKMLREGNDMDY